MSLPKKPKRFFITGTDTGVGKTYFACHFLQQLKANGQSTVALKPLATGCDANLHNEDALLLQQAATVQLPYKEINPVAFEPPIAPHIAAARVGQKLEAASLADACKTAFSHPADVYIVEGAGGLLVPLNDTETWLDFIRIIEAEIILVIGMRLGCLNHALLTYEAIQNSGCKFSGWVANPIDPAMPYLAENIHFLQTRFRGKSIII